MLQPPVPRSRQRSWTSLGVSAALHAALLALAVVLSQQEPPEEREGRADTGPDPQVDMVYLPPPPEPPAPEPPPPEPEPEPAPPTPPPRPQPAAVPRPFTPPPEQAQRVPEPAANAPPDAVRREGAEEPREQPPGASAPAAAPEAVTMESEARRIFGRRRTPTPPGVGPQAVRPMEAYVPDDPTKCTPRPAKPRDPGAPVEFGVAEGRILRGDNGRPLAGAHLQMLGTPYTAFTDDAGGYKFRFDLALVDNCRTQYVRVTAKGYESRLLVLAVGVNVRSEDVKLEKRSWWR